MRRPVSILLLLSCLARITAATAAPPALGRNDLLYENAHRCRNPLTGKYIQGWDYRCNEESRLTFAGAFACRGRRVEVFSYVHAFQTFAGSGNVHGGQRLVLLADGRLLGESEGLSTSSLYTLRVNARGIGTFRAEEPRDDGKTTEQVVFCGPTGLAKGFRLEDSYYALPLK